MFPIYQLIYSISLGILSIVIFKFVKWLLTPYNWIRDITDIGYNHIHESYKSKNSAILAINRLKRLRNVGDKLPPPYPNGWLSVAESSSVRAGQAISVDVLGQNFVVFRTESGEVHIFDAYCPHLGANLGVGGIVKDDCIECPFHQWSFRASDGECTNIPYSTSGFVPKSSKLKKWKSCEVNGAIFVWHHAEDDEPWELPVVKEIDSGEWCYYGRNEFLISCHIQEIPENGADVAHLNAVHGPNMLTGSDIRYSRQPWASFGIHSWNAQWSACTEENKQHLATMTLTHSIKLFNKIEVSSMDVNVRQVGPGYVQLFITSSFGRFVILQTVVPVEPLVQRVIHRFYLPKGLALFSKFTIWGESVMFERDMMIWNNKRYIDTPCLLKEDRAIKAFRNWFSQFYSQNSKSFANKLDW